ncbi:MAG: hypothetical protein ACREF4_03785 [Gammaproteobacteria bacterium]
MKRDGKDYTRQRLQHELISRDQLAEPGEELSEPFALLLRKLAAPPLHVGRDRGHQVSKVGRDECSSISADRKSERTDLAF